MIRRLIAPHLEKLRGELAAMQAIASEGFYPAGSLGEARLLLAMDVWQSKIDFWLAFLPEEMERDSDA